VGSRTRGDANRLLNAATSFLNSFGASRAARTSVRNGRRPPKRSSRRPAAPRRRESPRRRSAAHRRRDDRPRPLAILIALPNPCYSFCSLPVAFTREFFIVSGNRTRSPPPPSTSAPIRRSPAPQSTATDPQEMDDGRESPNCGPAIFHSATKPSRGLNRCLPRLKLRAGCTMSQLFVARRTGILARFVLGHGTDVSRNLEEVVRCYQVSVKSKKNCL